MRRGPHVIARCRFADFRERVENAAAHQERGLRGETGYHKAGALSCSRHRGKIDVRRDIGETRPDEGIAMAALPVMTHQRSPAALWVIVLGSGKSVIDEQRGA